MPDFASLQLSPRLLAVLEELSYEVPTAVQEQSIPPLLAGRDLVGQSRTGSGKTAAFALPILQTIQTEPRVMQAMVLCPTRELAAQVAREIRRLGRKHKGLQVILLAGGEPIWPQRNALERGAHIAVGTPGRVLDHLKRSTRFAKNVKTVVLDEADRMLDMGFRKDMEAIVEKLPAKRQTVLFSATFPPAIEALSRSFQKKDAVHVLVEDEQPSHDIKQIVVEAEPDEKQRALHQVLEAYEHEAALIFCNFKATVAKLARSLKGDRLSVDCLHGDLEQFERDQVLARFRNQSVRLLIATDVAGRGIDVEELDLVVNYELPQQAKVYVHRIGRTGRAGRQGLAVALAAQHDSRKLEAIEELTGAPAEVRDFLSDERPTLEIAKANRRPAAYDTILISGGRKDKIRPGDILGALTGEDAQLRGADIGKIEIHDRFSYVAVARNVSQKAVICLNRGRIKKRKFRASFAGGAA